MIRKVSNRRGSLVWAAVLFLMVLLALALALHARGGAVHQAFTGTELDARAVLLAESALDEALVRVQREASGAGALAKALASAADEGPADAERALADVLATGEALAASLAPTGGGEVYKLAPVNGHFAFDAAAVPDAEANAVLTLSIEVSARAGRRHLERTITRRHGLRVARLAMPRPFDQTLLFVEDASELAGGLERVAGAGHDLAQAMQDQFGAALAHGVELGSDDASDLQGRLRAALDALAARSATPPAADLSLFVPAARTSVADAGTLAPIDAWTAHREAATAAYAAAVAAVEADPAQGLGAALEPALEAIETLVADVQDADRNWIKVAHGSDTHRAFEPALAAAARDWDGCAWWELNALSELPALLGPGSSARSGVVRLAGEDDRDLDGAAVWGDANAGRLVIIAPGAVHLHDLPTPPGASLTVIAEGPVTIDGRVDADVIARGGLAVNSGAAVHGHLLATSGTPLLGAGATLDAALSDGQPVRVAFDPFPEAAQIR